MSDIILADANGVEQYRMAPMEESQLVAYVANAIMRKNLKQRSTTKRKWSTLSYGERKKWLELAEVACSAMVNFDAVTKIGTNEEN